MGNSATVAGNMGSPPAVIGDVIADKYSIESIIGEGGMGVVFGARHLELDQRVAIKFLLPEIATLGMAAERFRREARAAARIRGEHVCRVLDVGTLRGIPYMVMEYLEGRDLMNELDRRGRLPPEEAVGYVLEACDAVAEAHAAGIVHRDIKPANLFLATRSDGSRHIKVLDFGVSKSLLDSSSGQHALTVTSSVVGSPLYMSPEQLDSAKDVDRRTDIWALGVVLYELMTGRTPFRGDSIPQLVNSVLHDRPPTFIEAEVTAPDGLEHALQKALSKPRDLRYSSVAEFVSALAPFAPRMGAVSSRMSRGIVGTFSQTPLPAATASQPIVTVIGGPIAPATTSSQPEPSATATPWAQRTTDRGRRSRSGIILAALVLVGAAAFLVYRFALPGASSGSPVGGPASPAARAPETPGVLQPAPAVPSAPLDAEPKQATAPDPAPPATTGAIVAPEPAAAPAPPPAAAKPAAPWVAPVKRAKVEPPGPVRPAPLPSTPAPAPSGVPDFGGRR